MGRKTWMAGSSPATGETLGGSVRALGQTVASGAATPAGTPQAPEPRPKLLFLVTEDWYFWSHRLPVARAAREAGFEIVVATRVQGHGQEIRAEGFRLCPLAWRRRGDGIFGAARALIAIAALFRRERPDIAHLVALKSVLFGGIAARLAFARGTGRPAQIGRAS